MERNCKEERRGDVKYSLADISKIINRLGYSTSINFEDLLVENHGIDKGRL